MMKGNILGFWFAYIETLTALATIFLVLFVASTFRERAISEKNERLIKSWELANEELTKLHASPISDPMMGGMRITLADSVLFGLNKSNLTDIGTRKVIDISNVLVKFFRLNPNINDQMRIKVGGHTDRLGGDEINFPLSYKRANNVAEIIKRIFISNNLNVIITPSAYGSTYPVQGHYKNIEPINRRTTVTIELLSTEFLSH